MDGVSLALGAVSLGMQLMETASAVRELIRAYKSAAKELEILTDKLDDIEAVCHSLELAINHHQQASQPWDVLLLKKLHKILENCRDKVNGIHDVMKKIAPSSGKKSHPLDTLGTRFLQQKSAIRRGSDDLDQALNSLHLHMTTNILAMSLTAMAQPRTQQAIDAHTSTVIAAPALTVVVSNEYDANKTLVKPGFSTNETKVQRVRRRQQWYSLFEAEQTHVRKTRAVEEDDKLSSFMERSSYFFGSPLFGFYVKLSIQRGSLSPLSMSFQFPHVVCDGTQYELFDDIMGAFRNDDLRTIKHLMSSGQLTPTSTMSYNAGWESGSTSMIGVAMCKNAPDIFEFLLGQLAEIPTFEESVPSCFAPYRTSRYSVREWDDYTRIINRYIDLRREMLTMAEFKTLLQSIIAPRAFLFIINKCKQYFSHVWERFGPHIWLRMLHGLRIAISHSRKGGDYDDDGLLAFLSEGIANGMSIHEKTNGSWRKSYRTVLGDIVISAQNPVEAQDFTLYWIDILERLGVDIDQYLEREVELFSGLFENDRLVLHNQRHVLKKKIAVVCGRRIPSWEIAVPPDSPAYEVLSEFPHLTVELESLLYLISCMTSDELQRDWKILQRGYVIRPRLDRRCMPVLKRSRWLEEQWYALQKACDLMESRFERKQLKKRRKAGLATGVGQMPGAWVG